VRGSTRRPARSGTARRSRLAGRHADLDLLSLQTHSPIVSRCCQVAAEVALKFIGELSAAALNETGEFTIGTEPPGAADSAE
jgi:hypothetical protein